MIIQMNQDNMNDYSSSNEHFIVFGRIVPRYENDAWSYTEENFSEQYIKQYDDDEIDMSYVGDENKAVFLCYEKDNCIGRIKLRANWNGFALIEDIAVAKEWRHKGVGTELLKAAFEWAKKKELIGAMLETQDVNVAACRFYAKNRFVIGAVDNRLYSKFSTANEKAIFWYYLFS